MAGTRRERVRLSWIPEWAGPIEKWSKHFIKEHRWRCDHIHDFDDLLHDAYLIFLKIYETYPRVLDPPHFMALFKRAMWNNLNDHSRYTRRKRLVHVEIADYNYAANNSIDMDFNFGPLLANLTDLPEEVQQALIIMQTQPELARGASKPEVRANLNAAIWRILGLGEYRTPGGRIRPRLHIDFVGILTEQLT